MNANLDYYKVFYTSVKYGSISAAAGHLFLSQPAVSQTIRKLETELNVSLFFRTPKGIRLTAEGELLYSHVSKGYEEILLGERRMRQYMNLDEGEIRIGASDMTLEFFLLPFLERFHQLHSKIKVRVTNGPTPDTVSALLAGDIEFGIVSSPLDPHRDYSVRPVAFIEDVFIAGSQFQDLKGKVLPLSVLESLPIVCLESRTSTRRYVDAFLQSRSVRLQPEFELATSDLIVQFTQRNLGIGCVVRNFYEKHKAEGNLFELQLEEALPPRNLCLITGLHVPVSPAGKELISLLV